MNELTKESKFLDAINKYAEQQKALITQEIEEYKNAKIEQATEQGLQDAYDLIRRDIAAHKSAIVTDSAKRELNLKKELYSERALIADEVFAAAEEKLKEFAKSDGYKGFLERSCKEISVIFGDHDCAVSVSPFDEGYSELISFLLPRAVIKVDNRIRIGGIKAFCADKSITADDTLDTRLRDQRAWFIEQSGLKVV